MSLNILRGAFSGKQAMLQPQEQQP